MAALAEPPSEDVGGDEVVAAEHPSEREAAELAELRGRIVAVSPILVAACRAEGLSLAAVAHGVLPVAHIPNAGDGHSWLGAGGPGRRSAIERAWYERRSDGWERLHEADAAVIRTRSHPAGRWGVRLVRGVLHVEMEVGALWIRSGGSHCTARVSATIPETVMLGCAGWPIGALVGHPLLADERYVITSARKETGGKLAIRFRCPPEPLRFGKLRPESGTEHQQIGRDGSLGGTEATEDLVRRCVLGSEAWPWENAQRIRRDAADQAARINMMVPPWGERIVEPDAEMVAAIVQSESDVPF